MAKAMQGKEPEKELGLVFYGNQYIDTGIRGDGLGTDIEIDLIIRNPSLRFILGARESGSPHTNTFGVGANPSGPYRLDYYNGIANSSVYSDSNRHTIRVGAGTLRLDGVAIATRPSVAFETPVNILLGALNTNGVVGNTFTGAVFRYFMRHYGTLMRDFVPVRAGSTLSARPLLRATACGTVCRRRTSRTRGQGRSGLWKFNRAP